MSPRKNGSPLFPFPVLSSCVCCSFLHFLMQWTSSHINTTTEELELVNLSQHLSDSFDSFFFFFLDLALKKKKKQKQTTGENTYNCILSLEADLIITSSFTIHTHSNYRLVNPHSWCVGKIKLFLVLVEISRKGSLCIASVTLRPGEVLFGVMRLCYSPVRVLHIFFCINIFKKS